MENNIKQLRKTKHYTRNKLAELSGISAVSIVRYEDKRLDLSIAQFNTILKLTETLGCKVSDLFVGDYADRVAEINRKRKHYGK